MAAVKEFLKKDFMLELEGTLWLIVAGGAAIGSGKDTFLGMNADMKFGIVFAIYWWIFSKVGHRGNFNPALTVADVMHGKRELGAAVPIILCQFIGAAIGFWLSGFLGMAQFPVAESTASFTQLLVEEGLSTFIFVWLWLHYHDNRDLWDQNFVGLGLAFNVWISGSIIGTWGYNPAFYYGSQQAIFNPANWTGTNAAFICAPLFAAFLTTLVYAWYHQKN